MSIEIIEAYDRIADVRVLFSEYAAALPVDLCYQNYTEELARLPGKYAKPDGRLHLALADGVVAGCAAMRRFDETCAEMKRLYVRPAFRGLRLGRTLAECVIREAREAGYHALLLDTLSNMQRAQQLYRRLGFVETPPYYQCPISGTIFLRLPLDGNS